MNESPFSVAHRRADMKPSIVSISGMCVWSCQVWYWSARSGDTGLVSTNRMDFAIAVSFRGSLDRFVAEHRGAQHLSRRSRVVGRSAVQHAAVVPDHRVADRPAVAIHHVEHGGTLEQLGQQRSARIEIHAYDVVSRRTQ